MAIAWGFLRWIKVSFFPFWFFGFWFLFFLYLLYLLSGDEMGSWILLFLTIDWGVFCCFCFVGLNVVWDRPLFLMKMVAQGSMPQILWKRNHGSESKLILLLIFFNECKDFHLHKAQGGPSKSLSVSVSVDWIHGDASQIETESHSWSKKVSLLDFVARGFIVALCPHMNFHPKMLLLVSSLSCFTKIVKSLAISYAN